MASVSGFIAAEPRTPAAQYDVVLEFPGQPEARIPALMLRLAEYRSGGWEGTVKINPRIISAEDALQVLLLDGLRPGNAVLVKLLVAGKAVRIWSSVITSVNTTGSQDVNEPDAVCTVTVRDPLTHLGDRSIWTAFVDCPLGKMLGGVLSSAAGGDGRPTNNPILTGLPLISIREELRSEVVEIRYAIAAGDRLGHWLTRLWARLGVRISMLGAADGTLQLTLCDAAPSNTDLNADGGLDMTLDPSREASGTNLTFSGLGVNPPAIVRGGLLDSVGGGEPSRFGPNGALESVLTEPQTNADEASRRAGFRLANRRLSQTRLTVSSCQPGLVPGRVVNLKPTDPLSRRETLGREPTIGGGSPGRGVALLGASRWQAVDVVHLCFKARYSNETLFEKTGLAWRPEAPDERGAMVVSGVVDDGLSETGELVKRDRLGRVPIRFSFVPEPPAETEADGSTHDDVPWPPRIPLAPVVPGAGNQHGFVQDHRQGDWCRVAVIDPLWAEIIGYSHRDDRHLSANSRDATLGVVVGEDGDDWCGLLFRADAPESSDDV